MVNGIEGVKSLTRREKQVLSLIGRGHAVPEIAAKLNRSIRTIQAHRYSLGRKLGVRTSVALVRIAMESGLAPLEENEDNYHADLRQAIAERKRARSALLTIESGISSVVGEDFFRFLAQYLASALHLKCAFIGSLIKGEDLILRSIGCWIEGRGEEQIDCPARFCPCYVQNTDTPQYIQTGAQQMYPDCTFLRQWNMDSYMGLPLLGADGTKIGTLAVMNDSPIDESLYPELILRVFAARASAELQRLRAERALRASEEKHRMIVEELQSGGAIIDCQGRIVHASPQFAECYGKRPKDIIGVNFLKLKGRMNN